MNCKDFNCKACSTVMKANDDFFQQVLQKMEVNLKLAVSSVILVTSQGKLEDALMLLLPIFNLVGLTFTCISHLSNKCLRPESKVCFLTRALATESKLMTFSSNWEIRFDSKTKLLQPLDYWKMPSL